MEKWIAFCSILELSNAVGVQMISNQETLNLSPFMETYDIGVPKDNMLRQISDQ